MTSQMILFLDIETFPEKEHFSDLNEHGQSAFKKRFASYHASVMAETIMVSGQRGLEMAPRHTEEEAWEIVYKDQASFHAEFSRVACISVAKIISVPGKEGESGQSRLVVYTLFNNGDERGMLERFAKSANECDFLCAHNGNEFDFPFLGKRMLINGMEIPRIMDNRYKKPWEVSTMDTAHMWKMGIYKGNTSLAMISYAFGLPSPKELMDGSMVADYYRRGLFPEIANYCEGDVISLANVYRKQVGELPFAVMDLIPEPTAGPVESVSTMFFPAWTPPSPVAEE